MRDESRAAGPALFALLIGSFLFSDPTSAAEQVYPVTGVWAAIDARYPAAAGEVCLAVKTFGVEAARKAVAELTIFSDNKRYDVKGPIETRATVKSIKPGDGGFWITRYPASLVDGLRSEVRLGIFSLFSISEQSKFEITRARPATRSVAFEN